MMMRYAIYHQQTGAIRAIFSSPPEHLLLNVEDGESLVPILLGGVRDDTHWVEHATGLIHAKGDYTLAALPLPCTVTIEGMEYCCTTQPEFEFDAPGTYTVTVDAGPRYLKKEFSLENTPLLA